MKVLFEKPSRYSSPNLLLGPPSTLSLNQVKKLSKAGAEKLLLLLSDLFFLLFSVEEKGSYGTVNGKDHLFSLLFFLSLRLDE